MFSLSLRIKLTKMSNVKKKHQYFFDKRLCRSFHKSFVFVFVLYNWIFDLVAL